MIRLGPELLLAFPALLIALTFHEFAHAYVSDKLGDPTPRMRGRLTLNPIAHIDPIGMLMMLFFRFGWAKPVEVNPYNYDNREKGMALVSIAGPAVNLILGFLATILFYLTALYVPFPPLGTMMQWLIIYNVFFAVFNLLPIPPLDGSKILFFFLPRSTVYRYLDSMSQYGSLILIMLVATGVTGSFLAPIAMRIVRFYELIVSSILL